MTNIPTVSVPRELLECFAEKDLCSRTLGELMYWAREVIQRHDASSVEDVRAVVEEPVAFKLKECADGYGHGGRWCGPAYNCWLDPRDREERDEDFERLKGAASQRRVALPERFDIPHRDEYESADHYAAAVHEANTWNACLDEVARLNR